MKLHAYKFRTIVAYLQRRYIMPNCPPMFVALNESTLHGWFEADGHMLKERPMVVVAALKKGKSAWSVLHPGQDSIWGG